MTDRDDGHDRDHVTVRVDLLPDDAGFYVKDDGTGIPEADRERVFEAGFSSDEGNGLGLTIVARVVDSYGWSITATESDDGGARFEIFGVAFDAW